MSEKSAPSKSRPAAAGSPKSPYVTWAETKKLLGVTDQELLELSDAKRDLLCGNAGMGFLEREVQALAALLDPLPRACTFASAVATRVRVAALLLWSQERVRKGLRRYLETIAHETPAAGDDLREALEVLDGELAPEVLVPVAPVRPLAPARLSIGAKVEMATQLVASWSGPDREDVARVAKLAVDQVEAIEQEFMGRAAVVDDAAAAERALRDAAAAEEAGAE